MCAHGAGFASFAVTQHPKYDSKCFVVVRTDGSQVRCPTPTPLTGVGRVNALAFVCRVEHRRTLAGANAWRRSRA